MLINTPFGGVNVQAGKGQEKSGMSMTQQPKGPVKSLLALQPAEPGKLLDLEME